jgi:hypothetical protein
VAVTTKALDKVARAVGKDRKTVQKPRAVRDARTLIRPVPRIFRRHVDPSRPENFSKARLYVVPTSASPRPGAS